MDLHHGKTIKEKQIMANLMDSRYIDNRRWSNAMYKILPTLEKEHNLMVAMGAISPTDYVPISGEMVRQIMSLDDINITNEEYEGLPRNIKSELKSEFNQVFSLNPFYLGKNITINQVQRRAVFENVKQTIEILVRAWYKSSASADSNLIEYYQYLPDYIMKLILDKVTFSTSDFLRVPCYYPRNNIISKEIITIRKDMENYCHKVVIAGLRDKKITEHNLELISTFGHIHIKYGQILLENMTFQIKGDIKKAGLDTLKLSELVEVLRNRHVPVAKIGEEHGYHAIKLNIYLCPRASVDILTALDLTAAINWLYEKRSILSKNKLTDIPSIGYSIRCEITIFENLTINPRETLCYFDVYGVDTQPRRIRSIYHSKVKSLVNEVTEKEDTARKKWKYYQSRKDQLNEEIETEKKKANIKKINEYIIEIAACVTKIEKWRKKLQKCTAIRQKVIGRYMPSQIEIHHLETPKWIKNPIEYYHFSFSAEARINIGMQQLNSFCIGHQEGSDIFMAKIHQDANGGIKKIKSTINVKRRRESKNSSNILDTGVNYFSDAINNINKADINLCKELKITYDNTKDSKRNVAKYKLKLVIPFLGNNAGQRYGIIARCNFLSCADINNVIVVFGKNNLIFINSEQKTIYCTNNGLIPIKYIIEYLEVIFNGHYIIRFNQVFDPLKGIKDGDKRRKMCYNTKQNKTESKPIICKDRSTNTGRDEKHYERNAKLKDLEYYTKDINKVRNVNINTGVKGSGLVTRFMKLLLYSNTTYEFVEEKGSLTKQNQKIDIIKSNEEWLCTPWTVNEIPRFDSDRILKEYTKGTLEGPIIKYANYDIEVLYRRMKRRETNENINIKDINK